VPYWTEIYAPAATPKPIVEKLAADIAKRMQDPGREPAEGCRNGSVGSTPQELDAFNRDQIALYRRIVQDPRCSSICIKIKCAWTAIDHPVGSSACETQRCAPRCGLVKNSTQPTD